MATGTINGVKYNTSANYSTSGNRWLQFKYSTSVVSPGKTKVTWTLKSMYDGSDSVRSLLTNYALRIDGEVKCAIKEANRRYVSYNNGNDYSGQLGDPVNESGSFTVTHDSSGKGTFTVKLTSAIYSSTLQEVEKTITLTGNYPYTACSAPTNIKILKDDKDITSGYFNTATTSLTLSWSGAEAGTANSIKGYKIYYAVNGTPSTSSSSVTVDSTSTSGSKTITLPSMSSGQYIKFAIITLGSAGGDYNSGFSSSKPSATKNTPPSAPTISVNKSIVPFGGGTVTFTIKAGTDAQGHSQNLYYSTSSSGSSTKFSGSLTTPTITQPTTYYFWSNDGYDNSEKVSKTITVNTELTVEIIQDITGEVYDSYDGKEFISYFKGSIQSNKTSGVSYKWEIIKGDIATQIGTNSTIAFKPWTKGIKPGESYQVKATVNDGVESKSFVTEETFTIPANISVKNIYNQWDNSNIIGTNENMFSTKLRVVLPTDTVFQKTSNISITITTDSYVGVASYNQDICDITLPANLVSGKEYNFKLTLSNNEGLTREYNFSKTKTYSFPGGALQIENNEIKVFPPEQTATLNFSIPNTEYPYGDTNYNYNLKESGMILYFNNNYDYPYVMVPDSAAGSSTLIFNFTPKDWKNIANEIGIIDNINNIQIPLELRITNLFEDIVSYSSNCIFNMQSEVDINNFEVKLSNEILNENSISIREGQTLEWIYDLSSYNKQTIKSEIFICRKNENIQPVKDDNNWVLYVSQQDSLVERDNIYLINSEKTQSYTISEISTSNYIFFKLRITDIYGQITEEVINAGRSNRHIKPQFTVGNIIYSDENKTLSFDVNLIDDGGGIINYSSSNLKNSIVLEKENESEEGSIGTLSPNNLNFSLKSQEILTNITNFESTILHLRLKLTTWLEIEGSENSKISKDQTYSFIVYNIAPTVAVRKNHIGINQKTFEENEVVVISATQDRYKFILKSADKTITINLEDGSIAGAEIIETIINDCEIKNCEMIETIINSCNIKDCEVTETIINNCEITETIINNCNINNCEIDGGTW